MIRNQILLKLSLGSGSPPTLPVDEIEERLEQMAKQKGPPRKKRKLNREDCSTHTEVSF